MISRFIAWMADIIWKWSYGIIENFYVRIPTDESNITRQVDSLPVADVDVEVKVEFEDLMFYFAIALVSLMFAEWLLQIKKNF